MIEKELKSILAQIPQKKNIINRILSELEKGNILSGLSVGIVSTGYKNHISELYEHLYLEQRNCLHVIYEYLDVADKILSSFEPDCKSVPVGSQVHSSRVEMYKKRFHEILNSYDFVLDLIKKYLQGNPPEVFKNIK